MEETKGEVIRLGLGGRIVSFAEGGVVFIKGDPGDNAYVVASGLIEIRESGRVIERMGPGELFGEMAVIDSEPRSASAVAVGNTELVVIDRAEFERRLRDEPDFAINVMRLMARRLRATMAAAPRTMQEGFPVGVPKLSA
jgi:CRP/FNR family transcriptional regulator, cyclic AMP receptor protein